MSFRGIFFQYAVFLFLHQIFNRLITDMYCISKDTLRRI